MQLQSDKSNRMDEIKTQFKAREGYYKLMNSPDYSQKSQRAMGFSSGTTNSNSLTLSNEKTFIKISLVTINDSNEQATNNFNSFSSPSRHNHQTPRPNRRSRGARDKKICFNVGRELFVYNYDGVRRGPDASSPIYKRSYKGSLPTCHDFNQATASPESISLIVGFSHGQIQLIELNGRTDQEHVSFNVDRLIDKTRVTCVKWLPNSPSLFLVAHASGQLYLYKDDLSCGNTAPTYQVYKQSEGVIVYTCKTKTIRNPIYKWTIGSTQSSQNATPVYLETESCSLNEFVFSPCGKYLACVSQDGFLRVYCYDTMELIGRARSYYGGLSCVCWCPDGKYVVTGGEDDLITVWSFLERRVVARGMGHKSWVSVVAFDPFYTGYDFKDTDAINDDDGDDDEDASDNDAYQEGTNKIHDFDEADEDEDDEIITSYDVRGIRTKLGRLGTSDEQTESFNKSPASYTNQQSKSCRPTPSSQASTSYRFGSVGQDTQLCLWDLNDDLINQPIAKHKAVVISSSMSGFVALSTNINGAISSNSNKAAAQQNDLDHLQQSQPDSTLQRSNNQHAKPGDITHKESDSSAKNENIISSSATTSGGGLLSHSSFSKTFGFGNRKDKKNFSSKHGSSDKASNSKTQNSSANSCNANNKLLEDPCALLGTSICPRMNDVPVLEPTICKKISFERLTSLIFCKGGFITSCQDGYVFSWARPSRRQMKISPGQSNEELRVIDVGTSSIV